MWMDKLHGEVSNREAAERGALLARQRSDARALELSAAQAHLARLEALRAEQQQSAAVEAAAEAADVTGLSQAEQEDHAAALDSLRVERERRAQVEAQLELARTRSKQKASEIEAAKAELAVRFLTTRTDSRVLCLNCMGSVGTRGRPRRQKRRLARVRGRAADVR